MTVITNCLFTDMIECNEWTSRFHTFRNVWNTEYTSSRIHTQHHVPNLVNVAWRWVDRGCKSESNQGKEAISSGFGVCSTISRVIILNMTAMVQNHHKVQFSIKILLHWKTL